MVIIFLLVLGLQNEHHAPLHDVLGCSAQLRGRTVVPYHQCLRVQRVVPPAGAKIIALTTEPQSVSELLSEELRKFITCKLNYETTQVTPFRFDLSVTKVIASDLVFMANLGPVEKNRLWTHSW